MSEKGFLEVGANEDGEVVLNLDQDRTGHIVFSPDQARRLARLLWAKAMDADNQLKAVEPEFPSVTCEVRK
jgi:hypothetical protein